MADVRSAITDSTWSIDEFVALVTNDDTRAHPFDDDALAFCAALSRALLAGPSARRWPQLASLGYWLRPASMKRLRESFDAVESPRALHVPRGVVFHVTPGNVDTMFVYSWVLSLVTGNVSVVRISDRAGDASQYLLATVGELLGSEEFTAVRRRSHLVHTAHDDVVFARLSAIADVRVVWGGDSTVTHFRQFPLPPRGRDVTFPDRHSLALLDTATVLAADDASLTALGDSLFNDAYWFDQGGCSSPRLMIWNSSIDVDKARARLRDAVAEAITRRAYSVETGIVIEKVTRGFRAASAQDDVHLVAQSNESTWVELPDLGRYDRETTGGGLFFDVVTDDLARDLTSFVTSKDQTAACFGLDTDTVRALARDLNGRGIDRFVRMGRALEFEAVWDGYDLCQEFVTRVVVDV